MRVAAVLLPRVCLLAKVGLLRRADGKVSARAMPRLSRVGTKATGPLSRAVARATISKAKVAVMTMRRTPGGDPVQDITLVVVTTGREATVKGRGATERATLRREVVVAAVAACPLVGTTAALGKVVGPVVEACIFVQALWSSAHVRLLHCAFGHWPLSIGHALSVRG